MFFFALDMAYGFDFMKRNMWYASKLGFCNWIVGLRKGDVYERRVWTLFSQIGCDFGSHASGYVVSILAGICGLRPVLA